MTKVYYICINKKCLEVVHPRQIRNSDNIVLRITADEWFDFSQFWCPNIKGVNPMDITDGEELKGLYNEYLINTK